MVGIVVMWGKMDRDYNCGKCLRLSCLFLNSRTLARPSAVDLSHQLDARSRSLDSAGVAGKDQQPTRLKLAWP